MTVLAPTRRNVMRPLIALVALLTAVAVAGGLALDGLGLEGRIALFLLMFSALLWLTEVVAPFAVAVFIIGFCALVFGHPALAPTPIYWEQFVHTWSSPLIWLFLGGLTLAAAAHKTGLDSDLARLVLQRAGQRHALAALMGLTFVLSMFTSNTATAAMMLAVATPLLKALPTGDGQRIALLLGIALSASLGGMATLIGTPPNAVAAAALAGVRPVEFLDWLVMGLPIALGLGGICWLTLTLWYPANHSQPLAIPDPATAAPMARAVVMVVFAVTAVLWLVGDLGYAHSSAVVALIPLVALTTTGVLDADDLRRLPWDVLLLIAGGLTLGVAMGTSGLSAWLVAQLPLEGLSPTVTALFLGYTAAVLGNFVSHTGAANLLIPIALTMTARFSGTDSGLSSDGITVLFVSAVALGASSALILPISTPPNALVFATGQLQTRHFLPVGLLLGLLGPALAVFWVGWLFS